MKTSFDARKRLRPTANNRQDAVDRVVWGLRQAIGPNRGTDDRYLRGWLDESRFQAPDTDMNVVGFRVALEGVVAVLDNQEAGWDRFFLGLNYIRWAYVIDKVEREAADDGYSLPGNFTDYSLAGCLIAIARGPRGVSEAWASHLLNVIAKRGDEVEIYDEEMQAFAPLVLLAHCGRGWNRHDDRNLGGFAPLIASLEGDGPDEVAMQRYCDHRLSRAYEFPDASTSKAKPGSNYFFNRQWFAVFPFELLALQAVLEQAAGKTFELDPASHPILATPLVRCPRFDALPEDDLLRGIVDRCRQHYGDRWQPDRTKPLPI